MLVIILSPFYIALNVWILIRLIRWTGLCHGIFCKPVTQVCISLIYLFFMFSMLIAFFLPAGSLKRWMKLISNYWLGTLLFMTLAVLLAGLGALTAYLIRRRRMSDREHLILGAVCVIAVIVLFVYSAVHARQTKITNYSLTVEKDGGRVERLKIALVADLHIGYNIDCRKIEQMRDMINEQKADLVLIAGDIFDNEYEAIEDPERMSELLGGIESRYGTYAVYGNHDIQEPILAGFTFGGHENKESAPEMDQVLERAGIPLLRDEAILIDDSFYLYGRPDLERPGRGVTERKLPDELMKEMDQTKPVIILDHEPRELQELADAGADLVLNGHTHDGQMFPGNLTCRLVWENSCGYLKKGSMHNIVTSGVGLFGPYMRLGTDSEICVIDVEFRAE